MTIRGGLRARLIRDSLYHTIRQGLDDLGWFDEGRQHSPISFRADPVPLNEEIPLNSIVLSGDSMDAADWELGSAMEEQRHIFYLGVYGESEAISTHIAYDVRDVLMGKMPDIERTQNRVWVKDYRESPPKEVFSVEVEDVRIDRPLEMTRPWQKNWVDLQCIITDYYE